VLDAGEVAACAVEPTQFDVRTDHARTTCQAVQDSAPGIHDHAVPEGFPAVEVIAALVRCNDVAQVFNSARPHQHFPVRAPGNRGEGRGQHNDFHARLELLPEQLRETQVVADGQAHAPERRVEHHHLAAGLNGLRLGVLFVTVDQFHVEQMDLVVASRQLALVVVNQAGRAYLVGVIGDQRHGSADQPDTMACGLLREECLDGATAGLLPKLDLVSFRLAHQGKILGQHHQARLLADSLLDQAFCLQQVGAKIGAGGHLNTCNNSHRFMSPVCSRTPENSTVAGITRAVVCEVIHRRILKWRHPCRFQRHPALSPPGLSMGRLPCIACAPVCSTVPVCPAAGSPRRS
jgi:hypothetical protein